MKTQRKLNYFFEFSTGAPLPRGSGFQQSQDDCFARNRDFRFRVRDFSPFGAPRLYRRRHARRTCFAGGVDFIEMRLFQILHRTQTYVQGCSTTYPHPRRHARSSAVLTLLCVRNDRFQAIPPPCRITPCGCLLVLLLAAPHSPSAA